jgi:release factor glutamine methyltransferase
MNGAPLYQELNARLMAELKTLPDKPEETCESTLRALWQTAAGVPASAQLALTLELPELSPQQRGTLSDLIGRRIAGTPLAHLTGRQHFMDMEMLAGPDALVPRKETELLARAAVAICLQLSAQQDDLAVLDVCTGSGNVALAIAHHVPVAYVHASDLSEAAVELARRNAAHLGLSARTQFRSGDLLVPFDSVEFRGQVDVLTCNPPYINSAKVVHMADEISAHEPQMAFDGGPFGIAILVRLLEAAPHFLRPEGWLAFEAGLGQGAALVKRMQKNPAFGELRTVQDDTGAIRAILAQRSQV